MSVPTAPRLAPHGREAPLPLSYLQERLWKVERAQGGTATYNMPFGLRIRGTLNVSALHGSLHDLIHRHDAFRTTFLAGADGPFQRVLDLDPGCVLHTDLSGIPIEQRDEELQRRVTEESLRVFDLTAAPPLRVEQLHLGADDHALLVNMHHIISDGWSLRIMVRELAALYASRVRGQNASLPALPIQYPDYAAWQRRWLCGAALDDALGYWHEQLQDASLLELPTDRRRPDSGYLHVQRTLFTIPASVASRLQAFTRRQQATLFMVFVAAWTWTLGRFASQDDVIVGTSIANRGRREILGVVGLFTNNFAVRVDFAGVSGFAEALRRTKAAVLAGYERQEIPFQLVIDAINPSRPPGRKPFFDVTVIENRPEPWPALAGCELHPFGAAQTIAKYDLALEFSVVDEEIHGKLTYASELYDALTAERLVQCLVGLLENVVDNEEASVHDVPVA